MSEPSETGRCLLTGHQDVQPVVDFGNLPVAGYLCATQKEARTAPRVRHAVGVGRDSGHVQQFDRSGRKILAETVYSQYQPTYSQSKVVSNYVSSFVAFTARAANAEAGNTILEIGCNDGAALMAARTQGFQVVGFDPSAAALARDSDIEIVTEFFGSLTAEQWLRGRRRPAAIFTRHTLEHAFDPVDFLLAAGQIVEPSGAIVIEVPYLTLQLRGNHFEGMSVQHESFFSVKAMLRCLDSAGLYASAISLVPLDGGSMVVTAHPKGDARNSAPAATLEALVRLEGEEHLLSATQLAAFRERYELFRHSTRTILHRAAEDGKRIAAYGAGSKGQQVLNALGLTADLISYVIDDTPGKSGNFVPGCAIPVVEREHALADPPDIILITAPTHVRELLSNAQQLRDAGSEFFVTTPDFGPVVSDYLGSGATT